MKLLQIVLLFSCSVSFAGLTVYTDRPVQRMQPIVEDFRALTGETVEFVSDRFSALKDRLEVEGEETPADLVFTKDLVYLSQLSRGGFLASMDHQTVSSVGESRHSPNNEWVAITMRARTLVYNPSTINADMIENYVDLGRSEFEGALCVRTSKSSYNQALVSYLLLTHGEEKAREILQSWMKNLAAPVYGKDRQILRAIAGGECEIGIVNSYYLAGALASNPNFPVAIKFLEQSAKGVHTNGTGIGLVKYSKNKDLAQTLVKLMLEDKAQLHLSSNHLDYPARVNLLPNTLIRDWGPFKQSPLNWQSIGDAVPAAKKLAEEVGYN